MRSLKNAVLQTAELALLAVTGIKNEALVSDIRQKSEVVLILKSLQ